MNASVNPFRPLAASALVLALGLFAASQAYAHCDTMDGPVVATAKAALEKGDVTPVLKWVKAENEADIKEAFKKTLVVRAKGPEAKELADMYFFETLVRIHRAGEGAPYTGLKPAGTEMEPGVAESDKALETGKVDDLAKAASDAVVAGIKERFAKVAEAKKHADESVEAGRKFVAAYVEFVHYVERIFADAKGSAHNHGEEGNATAPSAHQHEEPAKAPAEASEHHP
ncbi:MAG: hypothetical protein BIFFINMI_00604 [Phycisphaerae bacterium]|nr:hypothetical protein [Phycisphaerae bacterium]